VDTYVSNLKPLLRAALNGPHAWVYALVAALWLLVSLWAIVSWASRGDAAASAALAKRALAQREAAPVAQRS
jgi:hypothetical protein